MLKKPPLNRRQALQRIGIIGAGAVATACGGGNGRSNPTPTAAPTATPTGAVAPTPTVSPTQPPTPTPTAAPSATATPSALPSATATRTAVASPTPSATDSPSVTPTVTVTPTLVSCVLTPQQILGPFFIDAGLSRRDVREDRDGAPLRLALRLVDVPGCAPVRDAVVNVWHTDAAGVYSGFPNQPGGIDATGATFLRGFQVTDADGRVEFISIYPGWYPGRTVHVHVRIHLDATTVLATQLYFPTATTDAVHARPPYDERGRRDTTNASDFLFDDALVVDLVEDGAGYAASIVLGVAR